jgi:hypothetical protein
VEPQEVVHRLSQSASGANRCLTANEIQCHETPTIWFLPGRDQIAMLTGIRSE